MKIDPSIVPEPYYMSIGNWLLDTAVLVVLQYPGFFPYFFPGRHPAVHTVPQRDPDVHASPKCELRLMLLMSAWESVGRQTARQTA